MFRIDQRNSTPIYQQLVQEVKEAILKGLLRPGERLPSVRELAVQLTINPNTIQKSYQELERQGIIENLQGKGTFVAEHYRPTKDRERISTLGEDLRRILVEAHYLGLNKDELLRMVEQLLTELKMGEDNR